MMPFKLILSIYATAVFNAISACALSVEVKTALENVRILDLRTRFLRLRTSFCRALLIADLCCGMFEYSKLIKKIVRKNTTSTIFIQEAIEKLT